MREENIDTKASTEAEESLALPSTLDSLPEPKNYAKRIKPWHTEIMIRLMEGCNAEEIARDFGYSVEAIRRVIRSPLFQVELERRLENRFGKVLERMDRLSQEATDKIRELMRSARNESTRLNAAQTILDRAGYGKIDKSIGITINAEEVIRELHRQRAAKAELASASLEATIVASEVKEASEAKRG